MFKIYHQICTLFFYNSFIFFREFDQNSEDFKLEQIIAMNFQAYAEDINEISNAATMELQIEMGIKNIAQIWETVGIEMVPYKDKGVYRLKNVDDCFQVRHSII